MMRPLTLAIPWAVIEAVTFYRWHWPHRDLLPPPYRGLLLAKGVVRPLLYIALTALLSYVAFGVGWLYAIGHPLLGALLHVRFSRAHGVDPVRVEPRDRYVLATTRWVQRLEARQQRRGEHRGNATGRKA